MQRECVDRVLTGLLMDTLSLFLRSFNLRLNTRAEQPIRLSPGASGTMGAESIELCNGSAQSGALYKPRAEPDTSV
jgi:hypothetical protein